MKRKKKKIVEDLFFTDEEKERVRQGLKELGRVKNRKTELKVKKKRNLRKVEMYDCPLPPIEEGKACCISCMCLLYGVYSRCNREWKIKKLQK